MARQRLKEAIKQAGYTQNDVAVKLNITHDYVKQIVGGKKNPSLRVSQGILKLVGSNDITLMDKN